MTTTVFRNCYARTNNPARKPAGRLLAASLLLLLAAPAPAGALAAGKNLSGRGFTGENPLGVPRPEFRAAQEGMELIYQRRYPEALELFEETGIEFPDSPLGPVGRALVYQAEMFENYDFKHDRAWRGEYADADARFKRIGDGGDRKAWVLFLLAVHTGVDAMYDVRHGEYVTAFNKAWDALEHIKKVERLAPAFVDVQLGLGLYNYWRTAITETVDYLPKFGDHRAEGLQQMQLAREKGFLAPAPASLALTYSHMEKRDWKAAEAEALWARQRWPQNVLNELTLGRVYRQSKDYDKALDCFDRIVAMAPDNGRVWFHIGETHYSSRKNTEKAREAFQNYLATNPLDEYKAHTYYRLGLIERRARNYDGAIAWLEKAVATWPKFKTAAARLDEVKKEKEKKKAERPSGSKESGMATGTRSSYRSAEPRAAHRGDSVR